MSELLVATLKGLKPGPNSFLYIVMVSPMALWWGALLLQRRLDRNIDPPQEEKLLRPPGYSLQLKYDDLLDSILQTILWAALLLTVASAAAKITASFAAIENATSYTLSFGLVLLLTSVPACALMLFAWKKTLQLRNTRLGLRGEQAVAEALHELGDAGFRAFHDLQPRDSWNIDHVAVGPRGVFLIETKARRRRTPRHNQPKHVATYNEAIIKLPFGADRKSIPQVEANCKWLRDFLTKKTGDQVHVEGLVVMPGWYITPADEKRDYSIKAMNAQYLTKYLRSKPERIEPAQVRRIIAALDEQCRTLEF